LCPFLVLTRSPYEKSFHLQEQNEEEVHVMRTLKSRAALLTLAAVGLATAAGIGCSGTVRYYDEDHHDYHRWNNHEVVVYHSYWDSRHENYRDFKTLNKDEQRDYWKWRHDHP
jgi:hypothetical protein